MQLLNKIRHPDVIQAADRRLPIRPDIPATTERESSVSLFSCSVPVPQVSVSELRERQVSAPQALERAVQVQVSLPVQACSPVQVYSQAPDAQVPPSQAPLFQVQEPARPVPVFPVFPV